MSDDLDRCRCGHTLSEHSKLIKSWPCNVQWIVNHFTGEWRDCPCTQFEQVGQ